MIESFIDGKTEVYGVIGNPVGHSFSPIIHNSLCRMMDHNLVYSTFHVMEKNLDDAIKGAHALGIKGLNVTIPHKTSVLPLASHIDSSAKEAGAANTLVYQHDGYHAYNTDVFGVMKTFQYRSISLQGKKILIIGAGGSARAVAVAMAKSDVAEIAIANRSLDKAEAIVSDIKKFYPALSIYAVPLHEREKSAFADIVIQTTSCGFGKQESLSPVSSSDFFNNVSAVLDIVYTPWETVFLKQASNHSVPCINGFDMLIFQGVSSYEIWKNVTIPKDIVCTLHSKLQNYYIEKSKKQPNR